MSMIRRGFTLVEVALFLAVSMTLFVGVMVGMQGAIAEQEKNDAVQNFAEFLRSAYSEAENVQNVTTGGNSEKAIYGKLITFGESNNLVGGNNNDREIFMYTVVGNVNNTTSGGASTLRLLQDLELGVTEITKDSKLQLVGISEEYGMRWGTYLQPGCTVDGNGVKRCNDSYQEFKGSILIVRQPNTGVIFTYYSPRTIEVNKTIKEYRAGSSSKTNPFMDTGAPGINDKNYLTANEFRNQQIDFCINVSGSKDGAERINVRIAQGANNASGVEVVGSERSVCE